MAADLAIETMALEKSYGDMKVLGGVDLGVTRGSVFCLLGPNGAGKTTMVRILATLVRPDSGHARVAGFDVVADQHQVRRSISLTGQYAAVDEPQSGEENLHMMGRLAGLTRSQARARAPRDGHRQPSLQEPHRPTLRDVVFGQLWCLRRGPRAVVDRPLQV